MVPVDYITFFTTMATVGATLFGLIFVAISIKPDITRAENISVMRQVQAASSYSALLNPLVISLLALMPHATIGRSALIMSVIGLINTIIMGIFLLREAGGWVKKWNNIFFILASLVMFGFELFYAIRLNIEPQNISILDNLAIMFVVIYLYGIARAWDLIGARQFHIQETLSPLISKGIEEATSDKPHTEHMKDTSSQRH
ncbi:hypothetical protein [Dictyobacter kobayashii]|uniref:Uncharacterized protein n=1 Tax=Dictyobacter kobayashii TaxID=2014872 RepID=A0A402AVG3_9CHLR|nr:hypothetical protein [Dictyobacter kobayashii]GCE23074.1 hypothetical protein KDK_68740 [Dictyobacter kobayashii]